MTLCFESNVEKLNTNLSFFLSLGCEGLATSAWVISRMCNRFISLVFPSMFPFPSLHFVVLVWVVVLFSCQQLDAVRTPGVKCNMIHPSATCMVSSQNYKYNLWLHAISNETFSDPRRGEVVKLNDEAVSHQARTILRCKSLHSARTEGSILALYNEQFFSALFLCEIVSISFGFVVKMSSYIFQCWFHAFHTEYSYKDNTHDILWSNSILMQLILFLFSPRPSCPRKDARKRIFFQLDVYVFGNVLLIWKKCNFDNIVQTLVLLVFSPSCSYK